VTFFHPLYLLGLILISVPILIHLWFRRRLKKIPFSTLMFLKKSEAQRLGWLRLREILVLISRCLFVTFLFLGLAKPQIKGRLFEKNRLASAFIILDNSYSMSYGDNFQSAKDVAYQLVSCYSPNSEFFVTPLSLKRKRGDFYWMNKNSALEVIKRLTPSYQTGSIVDVLINYPVEKAKYPIDYVYIGDGQEINFKDFPKGLIGSTNFFWLKIPTGNNIGITDVMLKDPISVASDKYELVVSLTNYSSKIWRGKIILEAGDCLLEKDCEIESAQKYNSQFSLPVNVHNGEIKLLDDSLKVDNIYFFSKFVPGSQKVLIVGSSEFLYQGLIPSENLKVPFNVNVLNSLSKADLRKFDIVILNGINDISEYDRIRLEDFLSRDGTGCIYFLGDEVGENIRNCLSRWIKIEGLIIPKGYITLNWIDYKHSVFTIFEKEAALKGIKFYRFQKISANSGVIARLEDNYPLIILNRNVAICATQFNARSTDIVYKPIFVPLLYRLIASLVYRLPDREFYVGDRITTYERLKGPDGEYLTKNGKFLKPGFYTTDNETIAVNVVPEEGNLKTIKDEVSKSLNIKIIDLKDTLGYGDLTGLFLFLTLFAILFELILIAL